MVSAREARCERPGKFAAPDLVDVETVAVLRKRWLAGMISDRRFASAIVDLEAIEVDRYPTLPLARRSYELRTNVTAYDAVYVALAEALDCDLVTGDDPVPILRARSVPRSCLGRPASPHQCCRSMSVPECRAGSEGLSRCGSYRRSDQKPTGTGVSP